MTTTYGLVSDGVRYAAIYAGLRLRLAAANGDDGRVRWWGMVARALVRVFGPREDGEGLGILIAYGPMLDTERARRQRALPVLQRGYVPHESSGEPLLLGIYSSEAPPPGAVGLRVALPAQGQGPAAAAYWEVPPLEEAAAAAGRVDGQLDPDHPGSMYIDAFLIWWYRKHTGGGGITITNPLLLELKVRSAHARQGEIKTLRDAHAVLLQELMKKQEALFLPCPTYDL
uniref:Uncharacterized protein n=1 Tax=Oryza punctata TaxID=4537 RepID=A0A0E0LRY4_ORYPU